MSSPVTLIDRVEALLAPGAPLPLVLAGDPALRRPADPYDGELPPALLADLLAAMRVTMREAPGVGLAAPQIGLGVRIAVIEDPSPLPTEASLVRDRRPVPFRVIVNPRYEAVGDVAAEFYEGCLSVPGYQAVVRRALTVRLRGQDETGAELDEEVRGWPARIVAHETDHLDGTLYLDRAYTRSLASTQVLQEHWTRPDVGLSRELLGF
ncbi:peptide deformylase [Nakamurella flavida]|uniref:Peptide deformylase n=1 Tax=Nakamurella flavida TaxID=363630 RepID=A0A938YMY5_9ACTN|nr:peptide deformylase [Nakamurella flavida]MBM9476018.1 peptide deformylase [Nakamurella flavida]MDP9777239.1 peptide deformylase [Nakamurella flavida]